MCNVKALFSCSKAVAVEKCVYFGCCSAYCKCPQLHCRLIRGAYLDVFTGELPLGVDVGNKEGRHKGGWGGGKVGGLVEGQRGVIINRGCFQILLAPGLLFGYSLAPAGGGKGLLDAATDKVHFHEWMTINAQYSFTFG